MGFLYKISVIFCFVLVLFQKNLEVSSGKILSVAFLSSKSHKITYEPLLYELASRGHEVTVLAPYISGKKMKNLREIKTMDGYANLMEKMPNLFEAKEKNEQPSFLTFISEFQNICKSTYDLPQVQELLNEKFDLIILSAVINECAAGFVWKFNTSLIMVSPVSAPQNLASLFGTPSPHSFVPNLLTPYNDQMTFYQRTINFLINSAFLLFQDLYFTPKMEAIYREKLNDQSIPSSNEIFKNASLMLSNSHLSLSTLRPFMPDIIEVGGMHCSPAKPLPKDLEDFMASSGEDGVILFSMGSALKESTMPDKYRKLFLNTFAKLKQKVLWKWGTEQMEDLPKNVKLSKWLPQQDILGHKKTKLFITHGGMGSTAESIYHGVPMVGIPFFGDQPANMAKNVDRGIAITIEFFNLTEEILYNSIQEVLENPKYREKSNYFSSLYQDQLDKPLEKAVYWTEYVLRHKGAPHLRSPARDLNNIQYFSIDVIAFLLFIIFLVFFTIFKILSFIFKKLFEKNAKNEMKKAKKVN